MEVIIKESKDQASLLAARIISRIIREKKNAVLGLATGSTPLQLYQELIRMHKEEELSFRTVKAFNLDEYVGIPPSNPASFTSFMHGNLFRHIDIPPEYINVPDGCSPDIDLT